MDEPPFEIPRLSPKSLFERATLLGYVVIEFASLEFYIDMWIRALLDIDSIATRAVIDASGQLASRCELLVKLAHTRPFPNEMTREQLVKLTTDAQSKLLPKRNRLVHDVWIPSDVNDPSSYKQIDKRVMLKRPQSRQPKQPTPIVENERTAAEMLALCNDISTAINGFSSSLSQYTFWREQKAKSPRPRP